MSVRENDDELVEACVEIGGAPSMGSRNITVTTVDDTATGTIIITTSNIATCIDISK